jgi:glycosyltransferase involved in cell wall biosynthesis
VDSTRDICIEYQKQNPELIKLLLQDSNKGLIGNYRDLLNLCRGKYIAQCAGDDYWCDKKKLQKQYDYLSSKVGYGFVRTSGWVLLENGKFVDAIDYHDNSEGNVFEIAKYGAMGLAASIFLNQNCLFI